MLGKLRAENPRKNRGKLWEKPGKLCENLGKHGKHMGQPWTNIEKL
jgi:hypothetical protein